MAKYRKLNRATDVRKAMLRTLATDLLYYGQITTTETRAKETRRIVEKLITMAVKEKDNFDTVTVTAKVPKKDANGKRVTVFESVEKEIQKDQPSRLIARRKILSVLYPVTEVPADGRKKRSLTVEVDMAKKLFEEIAPKYEGRPGGYTRIVKVGPRKGDGAPMAIIQLV